MIWFKLKNGWDTLHGSVGLIVVNFVDCYQTFLNTLDVKPKAKFIRWEITITMVRHGFKSLSFKWQVGLGMVEHYVTVFFQEVPCSLAVYMLWAIVILGQGKLLKTLCSKKGKTEITFKVCILLLFYDFCGLSLHFKCIMLCYLQQKIGFCK